MDFMTSQLVMADLTRRLKELKTHWKEQLNPYIRMTIQRNEIEVHYTLVDDSLMGVMKFPLSEVFQEGTCLLEIEELFSLNVRWKRTGLIRLTMEYPELLLTTLDGLNLRISTNSFYFPEIPKQDKPQVVMSSSDWRGVVLGLSKTTANQHPLKEYEYVWMSTEPELLVFRSGNEVELSCACVSVQNQLDSQLIQAFTKNQWLAIKLVVDRLNLNEGEKLLLSWNESFLVLQFSQQMLFISRKTMVPCYVLKQLSWLPELCWVEASLPNLLSQVETVAKRVQQEHGNKLPKGFVLHLGESGTLVEGKGWTVPYRSCLQFLKDYQTIETFRFGVSVTPEEVPLVAFQIKTSTLELTRYYTSQYSDR